MPWVEVFAVFLVSHLVGDYLLQTEWQAHNKHGGRRLGDHAPGARLGTYTLAYVPASIWLASSVGEAVGAAAIIAVPHLIQDDGRLLAGYARTVKRTNLTSNPLLRR